MRPLKNTFALQPAGISLAQLRAIHSLFRLYAPRFFHDWEAPAALPRGANPPIRPPEAPGDDAAGSSPSSPTSFQSERDQRLAFASEIAGRTISSFGDLTMPEASKLIDALKRALGQKVTPPRARRRPDRDQALAYGTAGRRAAASNEIQLVDTATLELLGNLVAQLGWTQERLDAFLRSRMSPVRSSGAIRTLAEANRAIWALKNMLRRRGQAGAAPPHSSLSLFAEEREAEK